MTDLSITKDNPLRVQAYAHDKVILINRPDALIVLCFCGGTRSIVLHVQASDARLPPLRHCRCDEAGELSTDEDNTWTSGGKVEHLYAHLKREE